MCIRDRVKTTARKGRPAILLPYKVLRRENPVKPSWEATSDSLSIYLAWRLKLPKLILLKDVDGIFLPPKKRKLLPEVTVEQLERWKGETCLDEMFPSMLSRFKLECLVLNGFHPERLEKALEGFEVKGTRIRV